MSSRNLGPHGKHLLGYGPEFWDRVEELANDPNLPPAQRDEGPDPFGLNWAWIYGESRAAEIVDAPSEHACRTIEALILAGEPGYTPGSELTEKTIADRTNLTANDCRRVVLPQLADCGIVEVAWPSDTPFGALNFHSCRFRVPNWLGRRKEIVRSAYFERYRREVTYAILLARQPAKQKQVALQKIEEKIAQCKSARLKNTPDVEIIRLDREIHSTICWYGAPDDENRSWVTHNLLRAFNHLNCGLPAGAMKERLAKVEDEHSEIFLALSDVGHEAAFTTLKPLLNAYWTHIIEAGKRIFDDNRWPYDVVLGDDIKFRENLECSVWEEVRKLSPVPARKFYKGLACLIFRSRDIVPLEWKAVQELGSAPGSPAAKAAERFLKQLAMAIKNPCFFYYVGTIQSLPEEDYEAFIEAIVHHSKEPRDVVQRRVCRIVVEPMEEFPESMPDDERCQDPYQFIRESPVGGSEAFLLYRDHGARITKRSGEGPIEETMVRNKPSFYLAFKQFLKAAAGGGGDLKPLAESVLSDLPDYPDARARARTL